MIEGGLRPPRLIGQDPQRPLRGTDAGRCQSGVEDERTGRVDQVVAQCRRAEHRATLAAQRFGQGGRHHHLGCAGQSRFMH
jgi:hypothetical protein